MSHLPESCLTFLYWFDDWGIPSDYRHMDGYGVHTFKLINKEGRETYCKFHWKPTCGLKFLLDEEAVIVGGSNHSHATKDLTDAIASGNYPEWKLFIQTMNPADEDKFDFDPLDDTKIWPEDLFPLQPVGRLVLNKNIDNFFNENEMLAFNPGAIVPGIYYTNDKMFQVRTFAYGDTQRHRLGPNYMQIPVNAPKCPNYNNHRDGFMNFVHRDEEVDYFPSRYDTVRPSEKVPIPADVISDQRVKTVIPKENNFQQSGVLFRSWPRDRQDRFIKRFADALSDPKVTPEVRSVWLSYWAQCDRSLGQRLASRMGMKASL
jgi:catalase